MAEISAKQVQSLREKTGLPLMDCKRALVEAGGDETQATELLRKRFADKMVSKADRVAAKGRIGAYVAPARGALVEVRCETDFVGTNEVFVRFANELARQAAETGVTTAAELLAGKAAFAGGKPVQALLEEAFSKLGEKLEVSRIVFLDGNCTSYVHHNGQIGTLVATDKPNAEFGKQVCMHVCSQTGEFWMTRDEVPAAQVEAEREKARNEVQGKPPQIVDKIVDGKMNKWYSAIVLPEQPFALDDKKSVQQAAREAGVTIVGFRRLEVGRLS
ncbi:MAG: translation elongation factor Ts [Phycisphaerae bacterium]|nr:translation elongation factor Ts [Phycisphaerae bacterium]NUQ46418.1 translation elongation factor Ts [Phycisphaerae bacterium]